jgi:hypothetical protein
MHEFTVASNGITFILSFMTISQLFQKLNERGTHRENGDRWIYFLLNNESGIKSKSATNMDMF